MLDLRSPFQGAIFQNTLLFSGEGTVYNPLVKYTWSTGIDGSSDKYLVNTGSSDSYSGYMHAGKGLSFSVDQSVPIPVTAGDTLYKYNVSTKTLVTESITTTGIYALGKVNGSGDYEQAIYNNVIVTNTAFTTSQVASLEANPEKFLYRENGILKSKVLTQAEIDNVKVYMPCIETDGFVRDYANYTEGADFAGGYSDTAVGDETITITDNGNSVNLDLTAVGTNTLKPAVHWDNTNTIVDNTKYLVEITFANVTGTAELKAVSLRNGDTLDYSFATSVTSGMVVRGVTDSKTAGSYYTDVDMWFDGSASTFKCDVSVKIKPLTGIYAIDNYTNSMNVHKLTTGLQTCFWRIGEFGIPNELMEYGIIGDTTDDYIDTGYQSDLSKYHAFEMVYPVPAEQLDNAYLFGNGFADGLLVGLHATYGFLYLRLYGQAYNAGSLEGTTPHIYLEYDNVAKQVNFYVNGVLLATNDVTISTPTSVTIKLVSYVWYRTKYLNLKLFNIHEEKQDPAKLYADAQNKGLL